MSEARARTVRFPTMPPAGGGPFPTIAHDPVPDRAPPKPFRALGDDPGPDRDLDDDWGTAPAPDPEDARLLDHLLRVARHAARHTDGVMFCVYEYSFPQILVLRAIVAAEQAGRPALSAGDVAQDLQCSAANASDLVAALHRRRSPAARKADRPVTAVTPAA